MHRKNILIYIQQDATLHILFYLETALHVSGGTTTYHQERKQLYLQHLIFVTPLLLPAAVVEEVELVTVQQIPDAVDTVVCAPDDGWWYHPKHVEQFPDKINCVKLHLVGYILECNLKLVLVNENQIQIHLCKYSIQYSVGGKEKKKKNRLNKLYVSQCNSHSVITRYLKQ